MSRKKLKPNAAMIEEMLRRQAAEDREAARRAKAKEDAAAVRVGIAETAARSEAAGAEFDRPIVRRGERDKPIRRLSGLEWLHRKKRIGDDQLKAGVRYATAYITAKPEASIGSILNRDTSGGDGYSIAHVLANAEARVYAAERLHKFRQQLGYEPMVMACDMICGEGWTPREAAANGREAAVLEAVLSVALHLLATQENPAERTKTPRVAVAA